MYATWYESVVSGEKKGLLASFALAIFTFLSIVYLLLHLLRRLAYKLHLRPVRSLPKKVISVGNLTVGGTGKTPFIETLSGMLRKRKLKPVILSRGYGSADGVLSDEYLVLKENLPEVPHYTGPNRYRTGMAVLEKEDPDVFLLDDGFQHWQLERDLDIVMIDALNPYGYGRLTPRGMMREPLGALERADMFVITRSDQVEPKIIKILKESLHKFNPQAGLVISQHRVSSLRHVKTREKKHPDFLKGKKVLGFCGIGNPRAFHGMLNHLGAQIAEFHAFRDHFRYTAEIVQLMSKEAKLLGCSVLVTTQKDGVKLREFKTELPVYELLIEMKITEGLKELEDKLSVLMGVD